MTPCARCHRRPRRPQQAYCLDCNRILRRESREREKAGRRSYRATLREYHPPPDDCFCEKGLRKSGQSRTFAGSTGCTYSGVRTIFVFSRK